MRLNKRIKRIIVTKSRAFCKHSSLHGVYYFYSSQQWWVHLIWTLILASSMALCCFLSQMIMEKFAHDPTLTVIILLIVINSIQCSSFIYFDINASMIFSLNLSIFTVITNFGLIVETTHYSVSRIPYPAVAVCDTELVYGPKTDNISQLLLLRGYNMSQVSNFFRSFTDVKERDYASDGDIKRMHFLLEDLGYNLNVLLDMFKKPCEDLLMECNWRSRVHNCSEMFRPVHTFVGHCCQFDISYFSEHTDKETNFMSGVEINEGLDILIDGEKKYADGTTDNGMIYLYVFDKDDKITSLDNYITLSSGAFFDVNVYVWTIDSSSYVKELPLKSRSCILDTDEGVGISYHACMMRIILKKVVDQCRCLPFNYLSSDLDVGEYAPCNWDKLICTHQTLEKVQVDFRLIISNSECYQKCDYVQYDTEVEVLKNQRNVREFNPNYSRVSVHFNDNTCIKYRREVLYTWDQMLANLGGIFGLCLGGSVISIIEIIWYLIDMLISIITGTKKNNSIDSKDPAGLWLNEKKGNNKVFTLSNNNKKTSGKPSKIVQYNYVN